VKFSRGLLISLASSILLTGCSNERSAADRDSAVAVVEDFISAYNQMDCKRVAQYLVPAQLSTGECNKGEVEQTVGIRKIVSDHEVQHTEHEAWLSSVVTTNDTETGEVRSGPCSWEMTYRTKKWLIVEWDCEGGPDINF
jgi:hypothetical protein